jgi:hypothetical protein
MTKETITREYTIDQDSRKATIIVDISDTLEGLLSDYGEKIIVKFIRDTVINRYRAAIRNCLAKGMTQEEIQSTINKWKVGNRLRKTIDPLYKAKERIAKLSIKDRENLLNYLQVLIVDEKRKTTP